MTARDVAGEHVGGEGEGDTDSFLSVVDSDKEENIVEDGGWVTIYQLYVYMFLL